MLADNVTYAMHHITWYDNIVNSMTIYNCDTLTDAFEPWNESWTLQTANNYIQELARLVCRQHTYIIYA